MQSVKAEDVRPGDVLLSMSGRSGKRRRRLERCRVVKVERTTDVEVAITVAPIDGGWTTYEWTTYKHAREGVAVERADRA